MAHVTPRTSFNSSKLIRFLSDLAIADVADGNQSFAERLGLWLDWTDAISLSAALNESAGNAAQTLAQASAHGSGAAADIARVRLELAESITNDGVFSPGKARITLPTPTPGESAEGAADFLPYRHYYLAHQRAMETSIWPLRGRVRSMLASHSPSLSRLAAVDAVLDEALRERERRLFSTVPVLLERYFLRLRNAHQADLLQRQAADNPAHWMQPGAWLARYCRDMQAALFAELETRLQPVEGLLEALVKR